MTQTVDIDEAPTSLWRLVERGLAGEDVVIVRNGKPLVCLVPVEQKRAPRVPGRLKAKIWMAPGFEFTDAEIEELFERWDC